MADTKSDAIGAAQTAFAKMLLYEAYWPNFSHILIATGDFRDKLNAAIAAGAGITNIMPAQDVQFWNVYYQLASGPITPDVKPNGELSTSTSSTKDAIGQAYADLQAVHNTIISQSPLPATPTQASSILAGSPVVGSGSVTKYLPYAAAAALLLFFLLR
jgi:hypothetical protein